MMYCTAFWDGSMRYSSFIGLFCVGLFLNSAANAQSPSGVVRIEDGRMVHDMYLVEVKTPNDSKAKWDYYKVLRRIPAEEAVQPLSESNCSLVKV